MERLAVGGKSGGVYCVPTSTDVALPCRWRSCSSTARRLGAVVGVSCNVELCTDVAGLEAWLPWKTCDDEGESRYDRCEPDRLSELAYEARSCEYVDVEMLGESVGEGELNTLIAATAHAALRKS